MITFCFNLALLGCIGLPYEHTVKGDWEAIPPGVRVLYLPPASTKLKMQRFEGCARYGLYAAPMLDMRPAQA